MLRSICNVIMSNLTEVIDSLENRISTLLSRYEALKQEQQLLVEKIDTIEKENLQLKVDITNQKEEFTTLKTANALLGSNDYKRETKLKINALIREIDACVVSLSE